MVLGWWFLGMFIFGLVVFPKRVVQVHGRGSLRYGWNLSLAGVLNSPLFLAISVARVVLWPAWLVYWLLAGRPTSHTIMLDGPPEHPYAGWFRAKPVRRGLHAAYAVASAPGLVHATVA